MRRTLVLVVTAAALVALLPASTAGVTAAAATSSPKPSPRPTPKPTPKPSPRPTPRPTPKATPTPTPRATPTRTPRPSSSARRSRAARDAEARRLIEQARREIDGEVADSLATVQQLSDALAENADEQSQIESQIEASQAEVDSLDQEIGQRDGDIATTQERIDGEQADIASLARELSEEPDSLVLRLLQAGSVGGLLTQASDLTAAALRADSLRQQVSDDLGQLQQEQSDRQGARDQQAQAQVDLADARDQLRLLALQEEETADQLQAATRHARSALDKAGKKKKASLAEKVVAFLQQREQELAATTEQQVWQQEQVWQSLDPSAVAAVPAAAVQPGTADTAFAWPIQHAVVTQGFGPTSLWLEPAMFGFGHFHTGLDLASPDPTVVAAADGVVAGVGSGSAGYGNFVIVDHGGGLLTLYGHLAAASVRTGDRVGRGQQIGMEGSTGASTGVHLHFEVRLHGSPVDPTPYLRSPEGA
jgi:murein DD-endopeptidase MepM/ murein hydrolase activator NlpD